MNTENKKIIIIVITRTYKPRGSSDDEWLLWGFDEEKDDEPCSIDVPDAGLIMLHGCSENLRREGGLLGIAVSAISEGQRSKLVPSEKISKIFAFAHGLKVDDCDTLAKNIAQQIGADYKISRGDDYSSTPGWVAENIALKIEQCQYIDDNIRLAVASELRALPKSPRAWEKRLLEINELLLRIQCNALSIKIATQNGNNNDIVNNSLKDLNKVKYKLRPLEKAFNNATFKSLNLPQNIEKDFNKVKAFTFGNGGNFQAAEFWKIMKPSNTEIFIRESTSATFMHEIIQNVEIKKLYADLKDISKSTDLLGDAFNKIITQSNKKNQTDEGSNQ